MNENKPENLIPEEDTTESTDNSSLESPLAENILSEAAKANTEADQMKDKYLRLYSEFDNYKKRTSKERLETLKYAGEEVISSLLSVLDDFERAIKAMEESGTSAQQLEGIQLIYNKFKNTLQQRGLTEMKSLGVAFDADLHEAVGNLVSENPDQKGKVTLELEKGYLLNGKIIRHAKVMVGN